MEKRRDLGMPSHQYHTMLGQFKHREEQTEIQEALVYLKLREYQCDQRKALIFAKKKERAIDGTIKVDGPANCKKLNVLPPESKLTNGWLKGEKLKYVGTTGYVDSIVKGESQEKKEISKYNQKLRSQQDKQRIQRSRSTLSVNLHQPKESLENIGAIKQDLSKERETRNMYVKVSGVRMDQTTKNFFKDTESLDSEGLVMKLGAFDHFISNPHVSLEVDLASLKGKSLSANQVDGQSKRDKLMKYDRRLLADQGDGKAGWQGAVQVEKSNHKQLRFGPKTVGSASNALILSKSGSLKNELQTNERKFAERMTQYESFYKKMDKAMDCEFLEKRRSLSVFPKRQSLPVGH